MLIPPTINNLEDLKAFLNRELSGLDNRINTLDRGRGSIKLLAPLNANGFSIKNIPGPQREPNNAITKSEASSLSPIPHSGTHENGGSDEIDVTGLSGLLADGQNPLDHASAHENGGGDKINVGGLSGLLANLQGTLDHTHQSAGGGVGGKIDHSLALNNLGDNDHNQYLLTDCSNDPLTGDLEILKPDPESKLTDTGDGNNTRLVRSNINGAAQRFNTVLSVAGVGNALKFDGSQYMDISTVVSDIQNLTIGTILLWVRTSDVTPVAVGTLFSAADAGDNNSFYIIYLHPAGKIWNACFENGVTKYNRNFTGAPALSDNTWHQIVIVQDGIQPVLYQDGVKYDTFAFVENDPTCYLNDINDIDSVRFANRVNLGSGVQYFTGDIDEVAIWGRVLSDNDASDLWNGGSGLKTDKDTNFPTDGGSMGTDLLAVWDIDELAMNTAPGGTDIEDTSANTNHGTAEASMVDGDFITGKINTIGSDNEKSGWKLQDGTNTGEAGILTIGDDNVRTIIKGGNVANTGIRFNLNALEIAQFNSNGTLIIDNTDPTAQQLILRAAPGVSENIIELRDSDDNIWFKIDPNFNVFIGSPTIYLAIESDGDAFWVGAGTGVPYGHMYVDGTQSIIVALTLNTPAEVKDDGTTSVDDGWLAGDLNEITFPTGGTEHYITITKPGVYSINWNISFRMITGAANTQIHGGLAVDGVAIRDKCEAHRTISNNTDTGNMAGSCMVDLPNGDEKLSLWMENTTNSNDAEVDHGSLIPVMVGGT